MKARKLMKKIVVNILILVVTFGATLTWCLNQSSDSLTMLLDKVIPVEIDQQAALEVTKLGGGVYNSDLHAIVPVQPRLVHFEWQRNKEIITRRIGQIFPIETVEYSRWKNTARTIDELLFDVKQVAPSFLENCSYITLKTDSRLSFGPANAHMVKSKKSLKRKVKQDSRKIGISEEMAVSKIGDALRGTIITYSPQQIKPITEEIKAYVNRAGGHVFFRNYWEEDRQSGYVGIHAKLFLPVQERMVLAELQIHLDSIMDGTATCVKEREHDLYEKGRSGKFDPVLLSGASKLLYLSALRKSGVLEEKGQIERAVKYFYTSPEGQR